MRQNLVIVRAGDRSLHPQWLGDEDRNWDLVVSYYGDFPQRYHRQYDLLHLYKGSKWQGIADFIGKNSDIIANYRYVWIPDDDIFTTAGNISRFFKLCDLFGLTVSQPALTAYSYFSWDITKQSSKPNEMARITNFVEIMAPCFKVEHLGIFSSSFAENSSGWGYEWLWWKLARENYVDKFGIIDCTPVFHTRPVGSAGHGGSVKIPREEFNEIVKKFNIQVHSPITISSIISSDEIQYNLR